MPGPPQSARDSDKESTPSAVRNRRPPVVERTSRVLWIDDEVFDTSPEVRSLRQMGVETCCAQSAEAALAVLESEFFDALLVDLNMPGRSGLDLLEDLASRGNRIPVLILTGHGTMERAIAAMKLGAVDVLTKPIDVDELAVRLRDVRARYPGGADPPSVTEADCVRLRCDRLSECINRDDARDDALAVVVRLLLSDRVTMRYFHGCAEALRLLLTSAEPSVAVLRAHARAAILAGATAPWPSDPKLRQIMAALEGDAIRQPQEMFARRWEFSRAYLSRRITNATGRPPSEWCKGAVLRSGLRRLLTTADPVTAVAIDLGYGHISQFDRDFAKTFGLSPTALRRRVPAVDRLDMRW